MSERTFTTAELRRIFTNALADADRLPDRTREERRSHAIALIEGDLFGPDDITD